MDDSPALPRDVALVVVYGFVAAILLATLVASFGSANSATSKFLQAVVFDVAFVVAAIYVTVRRDRLDLRAFGYRIPALRAGVSATVAGAVVYYLASLLYGQLFSVPSEHSPLEFSGARAVAFACVLAPVMEEFFFRGFVFGALRRLVHGRGSVAVAALLTGSFFGLVHLGSAKPVYLVPLIILGVVLCLVRWRTGSLYPCMAIHVLNNCLALGVTEFHWGAARVALLCVGSLAVVAALTLPLSRLGLPRASYSRP